jgi:nucleotide-binding universal stress UspA family protein
LPHRAGGFPGIVDLIHLADTAGVIAVSFGGATMRLDTIVIGMDFSPAALTLAKWVSATLAPRATIILVHAVDRPAKPSFLVAETLPAEALAADARAEAEDHLRESATTIGHATLRTEVRVGRADEVLARVAMERAADIIAVGPHGHPEHESMFLGTTADCLARGAPVPVLIGPRAPRSGVPRVLAAVEDAPVTPQVFAWADFIARLLSARLTILHALDVRAYSHMTSLAAAHAHGNETIEHAEIKGELRWQAERWLRECVASGVDASRVDIEVEHGAAAEAVLRVASRERAAMIVIGRHGTPRGMPALLGRTVRHVLHGARCAVLVVPAAEDGRGEP